MTTKMTANNTQRRLTALGALLKITHYQPMKE